MFTSLEFMIMTFWGQYRRLWHPRISWCNDTNVLGTCAMIIACYHAFEQLCHHLCLIKSVFPPLWNIHKIMDESPHDVTWYLRALGAACWWSGMFIGSQVHHNVPVGFLSDTCLHHDILLQSPTHKASMVLYMWHTSILLMDCSVITRWWRRGGGLSHRGEIKYIFILL